MPAKRSTRFTVRHFAKQITKGFAMKHFGMKHFTVKRPMAIGIIVVCIFGTAMLIVARSSEPTSAASITPERPIVAIAPIQQTPVAKAQKPSTFVTGPASASSAGAQCRAAGRFPVRWPTRLSSTSKAGDGCQGTARRASREDGQSAATLVVRSARASARADIPPG